MGANSIFQQNYERGTVSVVKEVSLSKQKMMRKRTEMKKNNKDKNSLQKNQININSTKQIDQLFINKEEYSNLLKFPKIQKNNNANNNNPSASESSFDRFNLEILK